MDEKNFKIDKWHFSVSYKDDDTFTILMEDRMIGADYKINDITKFYPDAYQLLGTMVKKKGAKFKSIDVRKFKIVNSDGEMGFFEFYSNRVECHWDGTTREPKNLDEFKNLLSEFLNYEKDLNDVEQMTRRFGEESNGWAMWITPDKEFGILRLKGKTKPSVTYRHNNRLSSARDDNGKNPSETFTSTKKGFEGFVEVLMKMSNPLPDRYSLKLIEEVFKTYFK